MASPDKYESYDIYDYSENELNFKEAVLSKLDIDKTDTESKRKKRYSCKYFKGRVVKHKIIKYLFEDPQQTNLIISSIRSDGQQFNLFTSGGHNLCSSRSMKGFLDVKAHLCTKVVNALSFWSVGKFCMVV